VINVAIVDDHPVVRSGLKQLLGEQAGMRVIAEAADGREAVVLARNLSELDVLVLDVAMPGQSGVDALPLVRAQAPQLAVLILSGYADEQYAANLMRQGASGYLNKGCEPRDIVNAIRTVALGGQYILPPAHGLLEATKKGGAAHRQLSRREFQVFLKLAKGQGTNSIAADLGVTVQTVSSYRTRLLGKLGLGSNGELAYYALRNKLIE
jgi:two-component system, NarL family, invasion response regulator UvrY